MSTILDAILVDVRSELDAAKARRNLQDLRARTADAPPPRDFAAALASEFGLIAEIKSCSPSVGPMREQNVADAPQAYEESPIVRAVSILTNQTHFGMDIESLAALRKRITKPILRKDFLIDEYQVREARAFGADAVLLMANVLDASRLGGFYDLARELGMTALFEVHTQEEIAQLPPDARVVGINSRKFRTQSGFSGASQASEKDFSVDLGVFDLVDALPSSALKVAESGISPASIAAVSTRFQSALVGTSLLRDPRGIRVCLGEFAAALA
jgi:indole-3-glycerol phosphate synthase